MGKAFGMASLWLSLVLAATGLVVSESAAADTPAPRVASLVWVRSPGAQACIGSEALSQAVARKLGREAISATTRANLAIEGRIERTKPAGGWAATLTVVGEKGEPLGLRELRSEAEDCQALDDEIALVVALLIEPGAILEPGPPSPPALLPTPPPVRPTPLLPLPRAPEPFVLPAAPAPSWRFDVQAGGIGGLGLLPSLAAGASVRMHATPPGWPTFEIGGALFSTEEARSGAAGANFSLAWVSAAICPLAFEKANQGLRICGGGALATLRAESVGLGPAVRKDQFLFELSAGLEYRLHLVGPLTGALGLGLLVPTTESRFYYVDAHGAQTDVFQRAPVAGILDVALGIDLL